MSVTQFIPTPRLDGHFKGSMEARIGMVENLLALHSQELFGEATARVLCTHSDHAIAIADTGAACKIKFEARDGALQLVASEAEDLKMLTTEEEVQKWVEAEARAVAELHLEGRNKEARSRLEGFLPFVKPQVGEKQIRTWLEALQEAPEWNALYLRSEAKIQSILGSELGGIQETVEALKESGGMSARLRELAGKAVEVQGSLSSIPIGLQEDKRVLGFARFVKELADDLELRAQASQGANESFCDGPAKELSDSLAVSMYACEVASRFAVKMTERLCESRKES